MGVERRLMLNKQMSIPGLLVSGPKDKSPWWQSLSKKPTQNERIEGLTDRMLKLELEVTLLKIQLERPCFR